MFAVIKTGGRQYRVAADDVLEIQRVAGEPGDIIQFGEVLALGNGDDVSFGAPLVGGASVAAEVIEHGRGRKVIAFKKRRRQNSKRKRGYRDLLTTVRISEILTDGAKPSKKAAAKPAAQKDEMKQDEAKSEAAKPAKTEAKKDEAKAPKSESPKPEAKAEKADAAAPLFKAPKGKADDLTEIKGIGPVAAKDLNEQGITTFAQLAKLTDKDIAKIDEAMPFSTDQISDWRDQAAELAKK